MNKLRLLIFLILGVCCNAGAQTMKTLSYNVSNNVIAMAANPAALTFSNPIRFGTAASRADTRANLNTGKWPMFIFTVPSGTAWTDFELKGTRTNFFGPQRLVFYFHSPGTNINEIGGTPQVYFTDSSIDAAVWKRLTNRSSISANRNTTNGSIGGIVVVITNTNFNQTDLDTKLVWSMVWRSATATDTNAAGQQIWRPVWPNDWVNTNFQPHD